MRKILILTASLVLSVMRSQHCSLMQLDITMTRSQLQFATSPQADPSIQNDVSNMTPKETLSMIEEAAGTRMYENNQADHVTTPKNLLAEAFSDIFSSDLEAKEEIDVVVRVLEAEVTSQPRTDEKQALLALLKDGKELLDEADKKLLDEADGALEAALSPWMANAPAADGIALLEADVVDEAQKVINMKPKGTLSMINEVAATRRYEINEAAASKTEKRQSKADESNKLHLEVFTSFNLGKMVKSAASKVMHSDLAKKVVTQAVDKAIGFVAKEAAKKFPASAPMINAGAKMAEGKVDKQISSHMGSKKMAYDKLTTAAAVATKYMGEKKSPPATNTAPKKAVKAKASPVAKKAVKAKAALVAKKAVKAKAAPVARKAVKAKAAPVAKKAVKAKAAPVAKKAVKTAANKKAAPATKTAPKTGPENK